MAEAESLLSTCCTKNVFDIYISLDCFNRATENYGLWLPVSVR